MRLEVRYRTMYEIVERMRDTLHEAAIKGTVGRNADAVDLLNEMYRQAGLIQKHAVAAQADHEVLITGVPSPHKQT